MLVQFAIGTAMLALIFTIGALAILTCSRTLQHFVNPARPSPRIFGQAVIMTAITTTLALVLVFIMAIWGALFLALGIFEEFETALYIAMISATTLGYGDVTLPDEWRLLAGFVATDGFILFGLDTAFLFEVLRSFALQKADEDVQL